MKTYWGVEIQLHAFLTSALDGGEWSASHPGRFTPREIPWYPLDRRLGGLRSGLDRVVTFVAHIEEKKMIITNDVITHIICNYPVYYTA
jgi:hypothetical protein